ncbi:DUF3047 domain-containing protein [Amphritea japonica]|uniref:DUF3047 domain-containing protein n=1 Tax=Amphritea japonica ATCC BAA-1530 TaxID=1278309 RepID=A0A7R6PDA0_9GAMM|nr:DUF3047 domain-containing protein [Amphritea japonica]BBB25991.1 conserved hypothetical protein [Amphritea japonica ATCC BAA-1530]
MTTLHLATFSILLTFLTTTLPAQAVATDIPKFDPSGINQWQSESFSGNSQYAIITEGDNEILEARSDGSASGLFFKKKIPINDNTTLNWRWKISKVWPTATETTKAGDDFPARVYIVVSDGPFFWQKRTLVYVWSNNQPVNTTWLNAYTDRAYMWALDSGTTDLGQWVDHNRNIQNDLKAAFGEIYTELEAIAIMTDSDNGGQSYLSWYDDIQLFE